MPGRNAWTIGLLLLGVLPATRGVAYETLRGPTELLYWDAARAYEGYTLFAAHGTTYLIDMSGQVVHTWRVGTNPKLLADGHILDASRADPSSFGGFQELDWDGQVVWQHQETRAGYAPHHDFLRVWNPTLGAWTTMYVANRTVTRAEAAAAGFAVLPASDDAASMDTIVEVDAEGTVIWEWRFIDHLVQDEDATKATYAGAGKTIADWPGRLDANLPGRPLKNDWLHVNSLDYSPEQDLIVVNVVQGEFYVIDHGGTFVPGDPAGSLAAAASPAGDFRYRFGDPARYERGDPPSIPENWTTANAGHKQIGGSHDAHWIAPGLPGAGHILVFNNGQYLFELTNQSYVFEVNPYRDAAGVDQDAFVDPPDAGYIVYEAPKDTHKPKRNRSQQIVWVYGSKSPQGFFSHIGGGAQRLPNGNTLICSDTEGHFLEVTAGDDTHDPEVVWEYVSPVTKAFGTVAVMPDAWPMTNSVFRAYRFGVDHPALAGRTLVPQGTITALAGTPPGADAGSSGTPDAGPSAPDAGADDVAAPVPDVVAPAPDGAGPTPDADIAAPDAGGRAADAAAPAPDAAGGPRCELAGSDAAPPVCEPCAAPAAPASGCQAGGRAAAGAGAGGSAGLLGGLLLALAGRRRRPAAAAAAPRRS